MKVILNSMKAGQEGRERERESGVLLMWELGEEEEDYLCLVIILSLLIVNYLILASYNPLVCPLFCDRQGDRGGRLDKTRKNNQPIYL